MVAQMDVIPVAIVMRLVACSSACPMSNPRVPEPPEYQMVP